MPLWIKTQNSEGRMKYSPVKKTSFHLKWEIDMPCAYELLLIFAPSSCTHALSKAFDLAYDVCFPISQNFGH